MRSERHVTLNGERGEVVARVRGFFETGGYRLEEETPSLLRFRRRPGFLATLSSQVERLPTELGVRFGETREGPDGPSTRVGVVHQVRAPGHLLTRVDAQYFRLEAEELVRFVHTGVRGDPVRRLSRLRRPLVVAVAVNVLVSAALVAAVGALAGFELWIIVVVAMLVAMINLVSIVGFADMIVGIMEDL